MNTKKKNNLLFFNILLTLGVILACMAHSIGDSSTENDATVFAKLNISNNYPVVAQTIEGIGLFVSMFIYVITLKEVWNRVLSKKLQINELSFGETYSIFILVTVFIEKIKDIH